MCFDILQFWLKQWFSLLGSHHYYFLWTKGSQTNTIRSKETKNQESPSTSLVTLQTCDFLSGLEKIMTLDNNNVDRQQRVTRDSIGVSVSQVLLDAAASMDPSGPKSRTHTQQTGASVSCRPSAGPQHHNLFQYQPILKKGHFLLSWPHPIISNVCEWGNQNVTLIAASSESKRRYNFTSGETE